MRRLAQATGWILLFAIAAVSVVPPELRPDTTLPHALEHAAIYFLAGWAFGVGYSKQPPGMACRPQRFHLGS